MSQVKVLVIGAGFAGLTAAIECVRHGHSVIILESFKELKSLGDIISFGHNAGLIFRKWPGVEAALDPICTKADRLVLRKYTGEEIITQVWNDEPFEKAGGKKFNGHRGEIHQILFKHAVSVGVEIKLGMRVVEYFEGDKAAGVICNGQKFTADVVLAADGVRSTARTIVLGYKDRPKSSGYAIYRAWYDSDELAKNPLTAHLVNNGDTHTGWLGPDVHFLAASIKDGKEFSWVCTHKDVANVEESWSAPGSIDDALKVLEGWDPAVHAMVRATPTDKLVDWKLVYRDPLSSWLSPENRIALIGDAAHPFLPTSVQGASQAMEDGATLAVCLELSGKEDAQTALRAYEKMRYVRVRKAQLTGETTRDKWHKADFKKVDQDPKKMALPRESWLLGFDAEKYAYDMYEDTVKMLQREDEGKVEVPPKIGDEPLYALGDSD